MTLVLLDFQYTHMLGEIRELKDYIFRLKANIVLLVYYEYVGWCMKNGRTPYFTIILQGLLNIIIGIGMCVPMGGYFVALLTPIAIIYLGALLYLPTENVYYVLLGIAITFIIYNIYLIGFGATRIFRKKNSRKYT